MSKKELFDSRVTEVRSAMGRALWEAQGVEQIVAKYYSVAFKLSAAPSMEEIEQAFENSFAFTAGRLVGELKKASGNTDISAEKLEAFVIERNWLVHKLRRLEYESFVDDEHYSFVLERIHRLEISSINLIEIFHNKLTNYFINLGTPLEVIKQEQAKAIQDLYGS